MTDKDRCGAKGLETPRWDPYREDACIPHDQEYEKILAGESSKSVWVTFRNFSTSSLLVAAKGAYALITWPLYFIVGGIGGAIRQIYLEHKKK